MKNPADLGGNTVLHTAVYNGQLEIYQLISKYVKDKNPSRNDGATPFHLAAQNGHLHTCKFLIENGVILEPSTNNGLRTLFAWHALHVVYLLP